MDTYSLVVANPPQSAFDAERAASYLGLTPDEVRAKANYHVPEIWAVGSDAHEIQDEAEQLADAGCKVIVLDAGELVTVPPPNRVRSFSFTDDGLVANVDGGDVPVPYDQEIIGVFCRPREASGVHAPAPRSRRSSGFLNIRDRILESGSGSHEAPVPQTTPFFDIYLGERGSRTRLTVLQNAVNFAGLGRVQPRTAANMGLFVERCEDRFAHASVDRRLEGMRLRREHPDKRASMAEHRRGYSYASPGLTALLHDLSASLEGITQPELSTRLAYLTRVHTT